MASSLLGARLIPVGKAQDRVVVVASGGGEPTHVHTDVHGVRVLSHADVDLNRIRSSSINVLDIAEVVSPATAQPSPEPRVPLGRRPGPLHPGADDGGVDSVEDGQVSCRQASEVTGATETGGLEPAQAAPDDCRSRPRTPDASGRTVESGTAAKTLHQIVEVALLPAVVANLVVGVALCVLTHVRMRSRSGTATVWPWHLTTPPDGHAWPFKQRPSCRSQDGGTHRLRRHAKSAFGLVLVADGSHESPRWCAPACQRHSPPCLPTGYAGSSRHPLLKKPIPITR